LNFVIGSKFLKNGLIVKNTAIYSISNILLRLTSFLLIPIYLKYLSSEEYGLLSTILVTVEFLAIIMTLGMREALIRFFHEYDENNQLGALMSTSLLISIMGGGLVYAICTLILSSFFKEIFHVENVLPYIRMACSSAFVISNFEHITAFYRAKNKALLFTISNISAAALLLLMNCIIIFKYHYNVNSPLISQILAYGIIFLIISILFFTKFGINPSKKLSLKLLRFGIPIIFSLAGQRIYFPTATYMLSLFSGLSAVAIFSLGMKFASILGMVLVQPFQMAFQPFLFTRLSRVDIKDMVSKLLTYFIFAITLFSVIILIGARVILPLMARPEYFEAFSVLSLSLLGGGLLSLVAIGEALVNIAYKSYMLGSVVGISGVLGVLLNYLLIPKMGWYGAIISSTLSSALTGTVVMYYGVKCYPILLDWKRIVFSATSLMIYVICSYVYRSSSLLEFCLIMLTNSILLILCGRFLCIIDENEKYYIRQLVSNIYLRLSRISAK
jgi:O-antigen/teichoic acid export membrane protein